MNANEQRDIFLKKHRENQLKHWDWYIKYGKIFCIFQMILFGTLYILSLIFNWK